MTDRLLLPTTFTDSLGGSDDQTFIDMTGMNGLYGFVDVGTTVQYFEMQAFGINHYPNSRGIKFYMLYQDADNHVRFESPLSPGDWTTYDSGSFDIYIIKDGVERGPVAGGLTVSTDALIAGYANADQGYVAVDGKAAFFGFGGVGVYANNLDPNYFGGRFPDPTDLPRGTMIGWDFTEFYAHWGGSPGTLQPWVNAWNGFAYETGSPRAGILQPASGVPGWTINSGKWGHRNNATRQSAESYNPGYYETACIVDGGSISHDVGHQTGVAKVRSRTVRCTMNWQAWADSEQYFTNVSYGGFFQRYVPYVPDTEMVIDAYWNRNFDYLRQQLDSYMSRYYGTRVKTDAQFAALVPSMMNFDLDVDVYVNGTKLTGYLPTGPTTSNSVIPEDVGTTVYLYGQSNLVDGDDDNNPNYWNGGNPEFYDFSFAPYVYGPFAYMTVTDYRDYVAWEAHGVWDGHWSQLASPAVRSSDIVRYRFESNLPVTFTDGSTGTVQDGTNPIADWRLKPTGGFATQRTWTVTMTVWNSDGLSDTMTGSLAVGPGAPFDAAGNLDGRDLQFYPYGPRPVA